MVLTIASDKDNLQSQRDGLEHTTAYWLRESITRCLYGSWQACGVLWPAWPCCSGRQQDTLADTMIPEAFEYAYNFAGLITIVRFLVAFVLTKLTEQ